MSAFGLLLLRNNHYRDFEIIHIALGIYALAIQGQLILDLISNDEKTDCAQFNTGFNAIIQETDLDVKDVRNSVAVENFFLNRIKFLICLGLHLRSVLK